VVREQARLRLQNQSNDWPTQYVNVDRRKPYKPHSQDEANFISNDVPKWMLLKGGEGAGKSVAGIIKTLNKISRGLSGIMVSPDLPHFKKSLWPEFRAWCPISTVVPLQHYRLRPEWSPSDAFFILNFVNGAKLLCGGIESAPRWEGANANFAHLDEGRHADEEALKVLDGRCRIPGPKGEPPQCYITTTPKKNWLYEYFGPIVENDKYLNFKQNSVVTTLPLELNRENLADGYIENRRNSLTESEARVRVDAEWEDESDTEKFVNIFWWDACREDLPALTRSEPAILSLDAAIGSETTSRLADCFAVIIVTRHPNRENDVAIRYCGIWQAQVGHYLDFEPIEQEIVRLISQYSIVELTYDVTQLHDMAMRLRKQGVNAKAFDQGNARLIADKQMQAMIMGRRISHDGNPLLRQHVDNADIKTNSKEGVRIIKRAESLKIDGAVATSQGIARAMYFNF